MSTSTGRWHYGWVVVGLTLVNQAVSVGILVYSFTLFVVPWLNAFDSGRSEIMVAAVAMQVGAGILSPFVGPYLDRVPLRNLVMIGIGCIVVAFGLMSLATAFWQIILIHATLLPIGNVLCGTLAAQTMVLQWFPTKRGVAVGISAMGTSIGGVVFPLVIANLMAWSDWQTTLQIIAVVALILCGPASWWVLRREPPTHSIRRDQVPISGRRDVLTSRSFWIPIAALLPVNASFSGVQFHLGAYVRDLGAELSFAAALVATTSAAMVAGKLIFGGFGDRLDHRKLYWVMAACLATSLVVYVWAPSIDYLYIAAVMQGLATGGVLPVMALIYGSRFAAGSFGKVMGLVQLFTMLGGFGALFSGWIFDFTGAYDAAFLTLLALLVPGALAMIALPPPLDARDRPEPSGLAESGRDSDGVRDGEESRVAG